MNSASAPLPLFRTLLLGTWLFASSLAACSSINPDQTYSVFFGEWSADLDAQSKPLIKAAARWALDHPQAPIIVVGYADPTGTSTANKDVSETRAQVVRDALIADGVPASRISAVGHGETEPKWTTQEARRAEIRIGGPEIAKVVTQVTNGGGVELAK